MRSRAGHNEDEGRMTKTEMQMIDWIKKASVEELVKKYRSVRMFDPFMSGKVGAFFLKTIRENEEEFFNVYHATITKALEKAHKKNEKENEV